MSEGGEVTGSCCLQATLLFRVTRILLFFATGKKKPDDKNDVRCSPNP